MKAKGTQALALTMSFSLTTTANLRQAALTTTYDPEIPGWDYPGAFHSSELWFVFETLAKCWRFSGTKPTILHGWCATWTIREKTRNPERCDADGTRRCRWKPYTKRARSCIFNDTPESSQRTKVSEQLPCEGPWGEICDESISNFAASADNTTKRKTASIHKNTANVPQDIAALSILTLYRAAGIQVGIARQSLTKIAIGKDSRSLLYCLICIITCIRACLLDGGGWSFRVRIRKHATRSLRFLK